MEGFKEAKGNDIHNGTVSTSNDSQHTGQSNIKQVHSGLSIERQVHLRSSVGGLWKVKAVFCLILWYLFSGITLFSNKIILTDYVDDPQLLGCTQIICTTFFGFVQFKLCSSKPSSNSHLRLTERKFMFRLMLLGLMRFCTVVLGLVSLHHVTVSLTETIKSTAPLFTVFVSRIILQEKTTLIVVSTLVPIMMGLALTSTYDLSFNMIGFSAALANNITDCLQNVYSKLLLSGKEFDIDPIELQFYTSLMSIIMQIPISLLLLDYSALLNSFNTHIFVYLLLNGVVFHCQSYTAYLLVSLISSVTYSVANTVKRALLIWLSVIVFGNSVTWLSGLGSCLVILGVFLYNQAMFYTRKPTSDSQRLRIADKMDTSSDAFSSPNV